MTIPPEPAALPSIADRVEAVAAELRALSADASAPSVRQLVDLAATTASISLTLLDAAIPRANNEMPGPGEAFERAAELTTDGHRHLLTAFHLLAGAHGITTARPQATLPAVRFRSHPRPAPRAPRAV